MSITIAGDVYDVQDGRLVRRIPEIHPTIASCIRGFLLWAALMLAAGYAWETWYPRLGVLP